MAICSKGQHNLVVIVKRASNRAPDAQTVVRWCCTCGSIVVDTDIDGRTAPGDVMQMRFPRT